MPTFKRLRYLAILDETRHFGRAAENANVAQPTLSQQIRALELRLGVKLIERNVQPVRLTPVGEEVVVRARRILTEVDELQKFVQRSTDRLAGTISLGTPPTLGPYLMPRVVARLHRENPDLRLRVTEGVVSELQASLARGEIDLVVAPAPLTGEALQIEPLFREPLVLVAAIDHPLAARDCVSQASLSGARLLSLEPRHRLHDEVLKLCERWQAELIRDYHGSSLDALAQMCASGVGMVVLPELYLRSDVGGRNIVARIEVEGEPTYRSICAAWRRNAAQFENYAEIAKLVREEASEALRGSVSSSARTALG